jgi:uncharacterized membrane protein
VSHDELRLMITLFVIGLFFSLMASIMAFIITYREYTHHYLDKQDTFNTSFKAAVYTFAVFIVLSIFLAIFLRRIIS